MAFSEKLIEIVKEYPILYNPTHVDYLSAKKKEDVWSQIGRELNETGDRLRKKWKNLKDSYVKYLKTTSNDLSQGSKKNYRNWPWAKQMETFRPFLSHSYTSKPPKSECDVTEIIDSDEPSDSESFTHEQIKTISNGCRKNSSDNNVSRKRKFKDEEEASSVDHASQKITEKKSRSDAVDLIFKGYAQTVKHFSPTRQAYTKLKIAQIIAEQEVQHHQEQLLQTITLPCTNQGSFRRNSASSISSEPYADPLDVKYSENGDLS